MKPLLIISSIAWIVGLFLAACVEVEAATGKRISDYTETLTVGDAWIYEIAVPGVTNYKVTFGAMATNIIARAGGGGGGSLATNANQFGASATLTLKNGLMVTNGALYGGVMFPGITALRPVFINAAGFITNASGTPDGTKFLRDDGVLAVPSGGSSVSAPISSVQFNSNGVMQGSSDFVYTNGNLQVSNIVTAGSGIEIVTGSLVMRGGATALLSWDSSGNIRWPSSGVVRFEDDFSLKLNRIQLGGDTAAFPSIGVTNGDVIILGADGAFGSVATNRLHVPGGIVLTNANVAAGKVWTAVGGLGGGTWSNAPAGGAGSTQMVAAAIGTLTGTNISLLNITANRPLFINALGQITNVTGTPNGAQFVRDDGVLAAPAGAGDVTTAQLNTASNIVISIGYASVRTNLDVMTTLEVFGHVSISSNLWVTGNVFAPNLSVVDFYANTATFTNGFYYTPNVNAGSGGNYTLLATRAESVIAATANVTITSVMGYDAANAQYWNLTITNGSGSDRTLTLSAVTNSFRFAGVYGTNAPSVLTNNTQLSILGRSVGTNVLVKYDYFAWP